jgi:hypothetical protein
MWTRILLVAAPFVVAACAASDDREWMKVNERYTVQDFRRDHAECSRSGKLDDNCMRGRGWVDLRARQAPEKVLPDRPYSPPVPR